MAPREASTWRGTQIRGSPGRWPGPSRRTTLARAETSQRFVAAPQHGHRPLGHDRDRERVREVAVEPDSSDVGERATRRVTASPSSPSRLVPWSGASAFRTSASWAGETPRTSIVRIANSDVWRATT